MMAKLRAIRTHDGTIPTHAGYACFLDEANWPRYYHVDDLPEDISKEDREQLESQGE